MDGIKEAKAKLESQQQDSSTKASASTPEPVENWRFVPLRYRRWGLGDFSPELADAVRPFLYGDVSSLYLHGAVGSRKTSLACAVLQSWACERGTEGMSGHGAFVPMYLFAAAARDFESGKERLAHWRTAPILLLDDVGSHRDTPHLTESLLFLIGHRYDNERKTIVTTNLTLADFAKHVDPRAASRFQEGIVLNLGMKDSRRKEK